MKTKTFFILCLVSGLGLTQLNAQNGKDGNGTISIHETSDGYWADIPVNCDDQEIERLTVIPG